MPMAAIAGTLSWTIEYNTIQYNTIQYYTILCDCGDPVVAGGVENGDALELDAGDAAELDDGDADVLDAGLKEIGIRPPHTV